ncbi:ATP-grasp domain-containing protein [Egibacter rhizosphaerae]|uniref:ATP-grasp domain-containing protein n=1 Tax=Egibacter rhizosphaerae TaxID=1670831 RepID=UPI00197ABABC|nr:hypothetical protein [Egibacter rhizosphaerae]
MSGERARVLLASARAAEGLDEDEVPLLAALAAQGVQARAAAWDDPSVTWEEADLVVLRSTWDYPERLADFLDWLEHVAGVTTVRNPVDVVRWNVDKRYLVDLTAAGVPTVPTRLVEPGTAFELPELADGGGPVVVKPAVAAGSRDALRVEADGEAVARAHVERLHADDRTALVQPYLAGVDAAGEAAVVYLGGHLSHAITKGAILAEGGPPVDGLFAPERLTPRTLTPAERHAADRTVEAAAGLFGRRPEDLIYARVDLLPADDGEPLLLELELTEPSLFLRLTAGGPARAAERIAAAARAVA